jgi:hypothetical protein
MMWKKRSSFYGCCKHCMNKKKRDIAAGTMGLLVVMLLLLIGGFICMKHPSKNMSHGTLIKGDSPMKETGLAGGHVQKDTSADSVINDKPTLPSGPHAAKQRYRQRLGAGEPAGSPSDSQAHSNGGVENDSEDVTEETCDGDTTAPWVYPDPSGGLHHKAVSIRLFATKPCAIEWKTDSAEPWQAYSGKEIHLEKTTALLMRAVDSCGNKMPERDERYELRPDDTIRYCPDDMEHVAVAKTSYCIDRYEWPNKKGQNPRTYVSLYQAMDTCASAGKRLCTSDEWTVACTGPYGWKYPYGEKYEIYACVTNDTTARPSGEKPECRGYFGAFDMSGNCAEWTSTRSSKNAHFYNVMGGFWESGPQSGCFDVRYSYFPQNRHNPIGFRCCKDARPGGPQRGAE